MDATMQTVDEGAHAASSSRDADDAASSCQHNYVVTVRALGFWILDFRLHYVSETGRPDDRAVLRCERTTDERVSFYFRSSR